MKQIRYAQYLGVLYCLILSIAIFPEMLHFENKSWQTEESIETDCEIIKENPKIALTFDDGPHPIYTSALLDGLKERNVKATFFLIGKNIEEKDNSKIVERMYKEGHLIGNHTYSHIEISRVEDVVALEELKKTNSIISQIIGEKIEFMRPPFGSWQKKLEQEVNMIPVMWNVDPLDWTTENVDEIVNKVVTDVKENDIILLHDCYESSVEAALRIVDLLTAEGYEFVTVEELILD